MELRNYWRMLYRNGCAPAKLLGCSKAGNLQVTRQLNAEVLAPTIH
jgi:hypothetical protein